MRIYQPAMGVGTAYPEDSFVVIDDFGAEAGRGGVSARLLSRMYPERPLSIEMSFQAEESARDLLFGALCARAERIRSLEKFPAARLFTRCALKDDARKAYFIRMGFDDYDGIELYALDVEKNVGERRIYPPLGTEIVQIDLATRPRRELFVSDLAAAGSPEHAPEWLEDRMRGETFFALAIYMGRDTVSQLLVTGNRREAVMDMIHTAPKWRGKGAATALITEAIRLLSQQGVPWLIARAERRNVAASRLFRRCAFDWIRTEELLLGEDLG